MIFKAVGFYFEITYTNLRFLYSLSYVNLYFKYPTNL